MSREPGHYESVRGRNEWVADLDADDYDDDGELTIDGQARQFMRDLHRRDPAAAVRVEIDLARAKSKTATDPKERAQLRNVIDAWTLHAHKHFGGTMKPDQIYKAIERRFVENVVTQTLALRELDADREKHPDAFYQAERRRILDAARIADAGVSNALRGYQVDAIAEARKLRAEADASIDPATRMADELERQRLVNSTTSADDFAAQAAEQLALGQPKRAALLFAIAKEKGGHVTADLERSIGAALDEADDRRKSAREIEQAVDSHMLDMTGVRYRILAKAAIGVMPDGSFGDGTPGAIARSSVAAKLVTYEIKSRKGEPYVEPSGVLQGSAVGEVQPGGRIVRTAPEFVDGEIVSADVSAG